MEGHRTAVLPPSSSGIGLYVVQDVKSSAAGKQIMKVEKFVQEVRELYTANSKRVRFKLGDAMSPRVIIKRLSTRTIEQYTRRRKNRLRSGSLSELDEFSASSYGTSEDEAEATVTQTPDVQTPGQHRRLSEGQTKEKIQEEFNKENVTDPHEGFLFSASFGKDVVQSDDDDDDDFSDVLDSDYSGDLPDLTDPSWESPPKTGSRKKSPSKKSYKKKHKRVEDYFKKRKDPKLMKSARKAFEHQRKIFRSTKKYEKRLKDVKDSKSSRLYSHKPETSEPEQSGSQLESWGQQLSSQPPNPVTAVNQDTAVLPMRTSVIHDASVTPSASDSSTNSKKEKIRQLVKANMYKTLMNPFKLFTEKCSVAQSQPQVIASDKQLLKEGMLLTQDTSQSEGGPVTSLNNPEALSSADPIDIGTIDMSEAGKESAYDSDETVTFEESQATHRNSVTSSNDVLVNNNNNVVKRINQDKSVTDCATDSKKRKRQGSESVDESCGEAKKRIKQEESGKPKVTKVHAPMVIIPSTTIETLVSVTPVSVSSIINVPTANTDHIPLQDHSGGSLEVAEKVSDIHAARGAKEKETHTCTGIGKQGRKEETSASLEGSALMLKNQFFSHVTSLEKSEEDKGLPSAPPSEVELAATGEKNRILESTEKGSPDKPINSIKELLNIIMELSNKRTQCEEKIKKIKEDCNKRIEMVEAEKREYEKEMEKMVSVMQNWRESSPDKSEADANQESAPNATAQDPLAAGASQRSTADSAKNTSLESTSQTPTSNVDQDPLAVHTSQGPPSDLASPDTGSVEVQQSTKKKQLSHDSSSQKYRKGTSVKTITLTDLGATVTEKLSSTQKQKKLTINVISAANINRFGSASTSPVKRRSRKSVSKKKAATSTASQTVPVSSTPPDQQLEELRSQTSRSSSHGTTTVASSGSMLLPQTQPTTQVQSSTSFLWPQVTVPGPQICPNVVVTSLMQNVQQQPARLQLIQPMLPPRYPPPPYPEHLQTLRAVAPSLNQHFKVVQQGTPDGMQTVSNMQPGAQVHQIQAQAPQLDPQLQIVSVQQQQSLQQPQQQVQQLTMQPLTQHTSSHQLTQSSQPSQLQQLLQQHQQQKLLQQQHRTTKQGSKGSKTGHQSHLLVSATPAPTLGGAVARSAQPSQPSPSAVSRPVCGSKSSSQPSTQSSHPSANSGTELPRALQLTHPVTASVNIPPVTVVEIPGQPASAPLNATQESPIDFSGGGRNKVVASTTSLAILSQQSCFLCGEKGELFCCNSIVYCGPSCQVKDWSRHESECSHKEHLGGST